MKKFTCVALLAVAAVGISGCRGSAGSDVSSRLQTATSRMEMQNARSADVYTDFVISGGEDSTLCLQTRSNEKEQHSELVVYVEAAVAKQRCGGEEMAADIAISKNDIWVLTEPAPEPLYEHATATDALITEANSVMTTRVPTPEGLSTLLESAGAVDQKGDVFSVTTTVGEANTLFLDAADITSDAADIEGTLTVTFDTQLLMSMEFEAEHNGDTINMAVYYHYGDDADPVNIPESSQVDGSTEELTTRNELTHFTGL